MEGDLWIFLLAIALVGIYFLGSSMTGWVISESCCFPPNCAQENLCEAAKPNVEKPANMSNYQQLYVGTGLIIASLAIYVLHRTRQENL